MPFYRPLLRRLFVLFFAYPITLLWLGLNVRHRGRLPTVGPAIIAGNHNSHLDTLTLLSLYSLGVIPKVRPVAAADYFMKSGFMGWFSLNVVGIIPIVRRNKAKPMDGAAENDPLEECYRALERGEILVIFPEGTRGEPERMQQLKSGVAILASKYPTVPVCPVYMHGLGKSLPKGSTFPIPFFVDVYIGNPITWKAMQQIDSAVDKKSFMRELETRMLAQKDKFEIKDFE